jgi:hypothetical protein
MGVGSSERSSSVSAWGMANYLFIYLFIDWFIYLFMCLDIQIYMACVIFFLLTKNKF